MLICRHVRNTNKLNTNGLIFFYEYIKTILQVQKKLDGSVD